MGLETVVARRQWEQPSVNYQAHATVVVVVVG